MLGARRNTENLKFDRVPAATARQKKKNSCGLTW